jgi:site-specific recombinase XerD
VSLLEERIDPQDANSPMIREMPLSEFDDRAVRVLRDRKTRRETRSDPNDSKVRFDVSRNREAANARVKALRAVLDFGFENHRAVVTDRWAHKVKLFPSSKEGFHCWTGDEIAAFRETYPVGTKERLAFELLYWTGQRRGDIVRLGRLLLRDALWEFTQDKNARTPSATTAYVPMFPELAQVLDASRAAGVLGANIYLQNAYGRPFTKESFGNWFRDVCNRAGLQQCSAHGLRKAFVVNMIHKGMSPQRIMSITGHRTQKEFDRYAREFLRREAALQAYEELCREHSFVAQA